MLDLVDRNSQREFGARIAALLRGAWRASPPPLAVTPNELDAILEFAEKTLLGGLLWWRIRKAPLAQTRVGAALRELYVAQSVRSVQTTYRVHQYISALRARDIEAIVFKGWALFPHYAEPGLRPPGDVDLAVAPHDQERAINILRALGATAVDVDVHSGLEDANHAAYIPNARWTELLARSQTRVIGALPVRVLAPEDAFQAVSIHSARHAYARPLWLCDVAALLETRPSNFDWERALAKPPYRSWIVYAVLLAHTLLDANIQDTPLAARTQELPRWLEREVLERWATPFTMGRKFHASVLDVWRDPTRWGDAVRVRVPNRLETALAYHAGLDEPFLARYQLRAFFARLTDFAQRNAARAHF